MANNIIGNNIQNLIDSNSSEVIRAEIKTQAEDRDIYLIGSGDQLEISVWKDENLTKQVIVRSDGRISFPIIGEVRAGGRTPKELCQELTQRISKFVPDPVVTVMVLKINSIRIYVIGNVNHSGEFIVGQRINVLQALSMAGGLNPYASSEKIFIIRTENQKQFKIAFNFKEILKGKNLDQNIYLRGGDVIVVP